MHTSIKTFKCKHRVEVALTPRQYKFLKRFGINNGMNEIIRIALDIFIESNEWEFNRRLMNEGNN